MKLAAYFAAERGRCAALARRTGISAAFLSQIASGVRPCPDRMVLRIVEGTSRAVREWDLCEGWRDLWPGLVWEPDPQQPAAANAAAATVPPDADLQLVERREAEHAQALLPGFERRRGKPGAAGSSKEHAG